MPGPEVTEAICLSVQKFSETSKIAVLYTRAWGRLSVIAKGAFRPKSQFWGHLEPLSIAECVIYKKPREQLQLLSSCRALVPWLPLTNSLPCSGYAFAVAEFLYRHTREEGDEAMFHLATSTLTTMAQLPDTLLERQFWGFLLGALAHLGFRPQFDQCDTCRRKPRDDQTVIFDAAAGRIVCRTCRQERPEAMRAHVISPMALSELRARQAAPILDPGEPAIDPEALTQLARAIEDFARYHLGGAWIKSLDFARRMESL
ncbi:MAG: DNA repair protein RecO [candidate division Zixibacteria bacterium]|nr:DNA repair protein RecO [candidate division Zixibacteria bacterium]